MMSSLWRFLGVQRAEPTEAGRKQVALALALLLGFAALGAGCAGGPPAHDLAQILSDDSDKPDRLSTDDLLKAGPLGDKTLGKEGAPVTVIEYASLTCPYCRAFHANIFPKFKADYIDTGKVYFIFREFPIGKSSGAAAIAVRCAPEKDYFRLNTKFLVHQPQWTSLKVRYDEIYKIVQDSGLSRKAFDSCQQNQKIIEGLKWVKERGRKLGVTGTPTLFVNGAKIRGSITYEDLRKLIESHPAKQELPSRV